MSGPPAMIVCTFIRSAAPPPRSRCPRSAAASPACGKRAVAPEIIPRRENPKSTKGEFRNSWGAEGTASNFRFSDFLLFHSHPGSAAPPTKAIALVGANFGTKSACCVLLVAHTTTIAKAMLLRAVLAPATPGLATVA
ncbi:hypothetical protein L596_000482 [Steinernema carpocapsae]|uniref:Uncharacterized protein n=1 Tax=Steinernema carpocapsae TaxID=34508 RepID=A0A4U8UI70_STECR|nr:hypothetical protein L596_000482 [Steinernema carpocapsae]